MKYAIPIVYLPLMLWAQVEEKITVIHKDVRVHVLAGGDSPVKGLTQDHFVLTENGKPRQIDYFEEVDLTKEVFRPRTELEMVLESESEIPEGTENRYVILFIDSSQMTPGNYNDVRSAVFRYIDQRTTAGDLVKLIHMDEQFSHLSGFTKNKDALKDGLGKAKFKGILRRELQRGQRRINDAIETWDQIPERERGSYEIAVNTFVKEKARLKANHYRTFFYNLLSVANMLEHIRGPKSIFLFSAGSYLEVSSEYGGTVDDAERLGRVLNRADATIYTLLFKSPHPIGGDRTALNLRNATPDFRSSLLNYGEFPPDPFGTKVISNTILEDNRQLESGPSAAAEYTGGLYLKTYTTADIDDRIDKISEVASHYYRLGYAMDNPDKRAKISIKIKDKQGNWNLLYGNEIEPSSNYLKLPKAERDIAFKAMLLYGQLYRDDLDARWNYHLFSRDGGGYTVPVVGNFNFAEFPKKGFEFGVVALDENRDFLDLTSAVLTDVTQVNTLRYYDVLFTEKAPRYVRASIRNLDNGDLSFKEMEVPPERTTWEPGPRVSEVLVTSPDVEQSMAINHIRFLNADEEKIGERDRARHDEDPFRIDDKYFKPSVAPYRFKGGTLWFMFHLENPGPTQYQVQFLIKSKAGVHQVPGRVVKSWQAGPRTVHYQGELNTAQLPPGDYVLWIRAVDPNAKKAYFGNSAFTIVDKHEG